MDFNGTKYGYIVNLQGDVLGLIDSNGDEVVRYTYDAWGKVLSTTGSLASTLGTVQPFRYRGYVYDVETGLYYLRARYYNPLWQRFVNADSLVKGNIFSYCKNNCISFYDPAGNEEESYYYSFGSFAKEGCVLYPCCHDSSGSYFIQFSKPMTTRNKYIIPGSYILGRRLKDHPGFLYCLVNVHNIENGRDEVCLGVVPENNTSTDLASILFRRKTLQLYSSSPEAELLIECMNKYMNYTGKSEHMTGYRYGLNESNIEEIKYFQEIFKLKKDGIAGESTQQAIADFLSKHIFPYNRESVLK